LHTHNTVPDPYPLLLVSIALTALASALMTLYLLRNMSARRHQAALHDREQRLRLALWATGEFYWEFNLADGKVSWLLGEVRDKENPSAPAIASKPTESTVDVTSLLHPEDLARAQTTLDLYLAGKSHTFDAEFRIQRTVGWRWVRVRGRAVAYDAAARVTRIAGTALDISQTHVIERERQIAGHVLASMAEAVVVVDQSLNFVSVNPAFERMSGLERETIIGQNMRLLSPRRHSLAQYDTLSQALRQSGNWSGELWQRGRHDEDFLCTVEVTTIRADHHFPQLHVAVFNDITQQKHTEQRLHYLTHFDPLTNLPNRSLLAERLPRTIVNARRRKTRVAMLFLDLDRFRDINERFGPAAGDGILRVVAQRLQQVVGIRHTVARLGGDEFAVVLDHLESQDAADHTAQDILSAFDHPLTLEGDLEVAVSFSIGISLYPDHALISDELIKQADTAMYQAKTAGRRMFMRYDSKMETQTRQRAVLAGTLHKALDRGELKLVFQPRLALANSKITHVEVLLRWFNHEYGEIDPADFIPLAEENGMIVDIGRWALNEACLTLHDWRRQGLSEVMISVNISLLQLLSDDFPQMVQDILDTSGIPPEALELELTESILMVNIEQAASRLQAFRALGVSVAVDDFGTGYSSLAYLKRLPVNTIKIDKAFIKGLPRDGEDAAIATSIIHMGHSLGMKVVAEGVETDAQRQFLAERRCDEIQGFWLAKPMPAEQALAFIQHWSQSPPHGPNDNGGGAIAAAVMAAHPDAPPGSPAE